MPIYTYICPACGKEEDHLEKFDVSSDEPRKCSCSYIMHREVSAPGLIKFKGTGFYETDFKGK